MSSPVPIAILMATYNGARYVEEQVASLQAQTRRDWQLYICDDGSTDDTLKVLARIVDSDERISMLDDPVKNKGVGDRFCWMLEQTRNQHEIFFFCDQDDVWLPEKIDRTARTIESSDRQVPLLVHCDLIIVDESLKIVRKSHFAHAGFSSRPYRIDELVAKTHILGCALAFNKALAAIALPMPKMPSPEILMAHDWWLTLVASLRGKIVTIPEGLIYYRQHGRNVFGAGPGGNRRWHLLSLSFVMERFSRKASFSRYAFEFVHPLPRLENLRRIYGGLERPTGLLTKGRRRDLLEYIFRYRIFSQDPLTTMILISDALRRGSRAHGDAGSESSVQEN